VRAAGFELVVNLALPTSDHALPDEGSIVTGLGMSYIHIPVNFDHPEAQDFDAFCRLMDAFGERRVFVHCAANMRVSAFVFLYRVLHQRHPLAEAQQDLHAIWHPNDTWSCFIKQRLGKDTPHGRPSQSPKVLECSSPLPL
jgi:protein tyrosine phosphatase (PTP) superfamily phosphohydrolase (DUF442 family)